MKDYEKGRKRRVALPEPEERYETIRHYIAALLEGSKSGSTFYVLRSISPFRV